MPTPTTTTPARWPWERTERAERLWGDVYARCVAEGFALNLPTIMREGAALATASTLSVLARITANDALKQATAQWERERLALEAGAP